MQKLSIINQNSIAVLKKAKSLIQISNNILNNNSRISNNQTDVIKLHNNTTTWIDRTTELMWECKNEKNIAHKYVWAENYVKNAWKEEYLTDEIKDIFSYVKELNKNKYCSFSDWRIPSLEELKSLLITDNDYDTKKPLSGLLGLAYWISTTDDNYTSTAWIVSSDDKLSNRNGKYMANNLICVRTI